MYILPINGVIGEDFKYQDLLLHLNAAKEERVIKLLINSPGGYTDEANKIEKTLLSQNKVYYSTNTGDVASAAVQLFLVAPKENRTFDPAKGKFLIHMPFLDPKDGGVSGNSKIIQAVADGMKDLEREMIKKYSKATGSEVAIIEGFMGENTPLTTEQISQLGFANIIQQELNAVAYYKFKNDDKMNEEVEKKIGTIESLLNKIVAFVRPKSLMIQDVDGNELDFGAEIEDAAQIAIGDTATVAGAPANGDYVMPDGSVLVFENGTLQEMKPVEEDEMQALKTENETLKSELEGLKSEKAALSASHEEFKSEADTQIKNLQTEFKKFKAQFSTGDEGGTSLPGGESEKEKSTVRRAFKVK